MVNLPENASIRDTVKSISVSNNILNNTTLLAVGELKNSGGISLGENSIISKIKDLLFKFSF